MITAQLSLCMIVKNEAEHMSSCLESARGLVDEMIVVDTGSEDDTPRIARSFGAEVYFSPWQDDFSQARNVSLEHAKGDWILVLDADECLDPRDHGRMQTLMSDPQADAYRLIQRTYQKHSTLAEWQTLEADTPLARGCPGFIPNPLVRLFRNSPHIRFKGQVHEVVEHDLLTHGKRIVDSDIQIHHYGLIIEESRQHLKQNLYRRIGETKLKNQPQDTRAHVELGVQYLEMNQIDSAVSVLEQAATQDPQNVRAAFNLAIAYARRGNSDEAVQCYKTVLALDPTHTGACNNLAQILLNSNGSTDKAESLYRQAIRNNPDHHALHYNFGLFLEKDGRYQAAMERYRKSLTIDPDFHPARERMEIMDRSTIPVEAELHPANKERRSGRFGPGNIVMNCEQDILSQVRTCMESGEYEAALGLLVDALEKTPADTNLRYQCGYVLEKLGKKDDALEQYQEALAVNPKHPDTLFRLAVEAENQGLMEDCKTIYQELFEVAPDHQKARDRFARVFKNGSENELFNRKPPTDAEHSDRQNIVFVWGGSPFFGDTLEKHPIGGTETAVIHMSRHLARNGHSVRVFVKGGRGIHEGVEYRDLQNYIRDLEKEPADVLVVSRTFHPFINRVNARTRIFWTEDAHDQPFVEFLARTEIVSNIDSIFTVSQWQTDRLSKTFNIPSSKFYVTRNGVSWDHYKNPPAERNYRKLVYTSTPFRGLDVLLDIFPKIRQRVPDAQLDVYSSMQVYGISSAEDEAAYGHIYRKSDQPGVTLKGSVPQGDLAKALLESGIMAYPNHFAETSCIAVMEALAAGIPVVTTSLGALVETASAGGVLIDGDPRTEAYQDCFVEELCHILEDAPRWKELSRQARTHIYENNRWEIIAKEWEAEFRSLLIPQTEIAGAGNQGLQVSSLSSEQMMEEEHLPGNYEALDPYFGRFFSLMRMAIAPGGSEFGLGIGLFSLAVTINAAEIIEIGRFKGFSTLALASALKFLDIGWQEPHQHRQRPDIDYAEFERAKPRKLYSIDPYPIREAKDRIESAGVADYVEFINQPSGLIEMSGMVDLIFIDGDHSYQGCMSDVERFVPGNLRPGGYFILHDFFGWYDQHGTNHSPIKRVVDKLVTGGEYEHILMDTGYQSFVVFRRPVGRLERTSVSYG